MAAEQNHSVDAIPGLSSKQAEALEGHWITTVEQVVGLAATSQGVQSLCHLLDADKKEVETLLESAKSLLSPAQVRELSEEVDPSQYGMGALPPN